MKQPAVYIMATTQNGTIYTGVTSNLVKRAYEHRNGLISGFTKDHGCKLLVFFELHETALGGEDGKIVSVFEQL